MPRPEARDPGPTPAGGVGGLPAVGAWPPRTRWPEPLHRAVAAVREALAGDGSCRADAGPGRAGNRPRGLVALSGGADSLALAVACAVLVGTRDGARLGPIGAAVVDHGLQSGSDAVAAAAADVARILGLTPVTVTRVEVARTGDGPEADARRARREALAAAARDAGQGAPPSSSPPTPPTIRPNRSSSGSHAAPARGPSRGSRRAGRCRAGPPSSAPCWA